MHNAIPCDGRSVWQDVFFGENPELDGQGFWVHHAIPRKIFRDYPGLIDPALENDISNLRGVSPASNNQIHLGDIGTLWLRLVKTNGSALTSEQVYWMRDFIDTIYGSILRR